MMYNLYMFDHNILHICFWTLPAIVVGIIMVVMAVVHNRNQKKREEAFEEEMELRPDAQTQTSDTAQV